MKTVIVTGASGLVGAEAVRFLHDKGFLIIGVDNDMRKKFFGDDASTRWQTDKLMNLPYYKHWFSDIRSENTINNLFDKYNNDIKLVIHAAAQPSHDWAAQNPSMDYSINATGTSILLEATRKYCPCATFIYLSTNKVYGDTPNYLPLLEEDMRYEIELKHNFHNYGIDETMSIDQSTHSLFGASKLAGDILTQEYGKYFGMNTGIFRCGCITGSGHSSVKSHGFLSYLMKCVITGNIYTIFGYDGKQVRDNIHCSDLIKAFYRFYQNPRQGEVYNMGGSRHSNCSVREAIIKCQNVANKKLDVDYSNVNRIGDHKWWISNVSKFKKHYPKWRFNYDINDIINELYSGLVQRI